jgi:hypothetical protein
MFPAAALEKTEFVERKLYLAWSRPEGTGIVKGETNMNTYKFAAYPSNSTVATGVTLLVSAWFLVAAGAILADPASPYTHRSEASAAAPVKSARAEAPAPQARSTILVSVKRSPT